MLVLALCFFQFFAISVGLLTSKSRVVNDVLVSCSIFANSLFEKKKKKKILAWTVSVLWEVYPLCSR